MKKTGPGFATGGRERKRPRPSRKKGDKAKVNSLRRRRWEVRGAALLRNWQKATTHLGRRWSRSCLPKIAVHGQKKKKKKGTAPEQARAAQERSQTPASRAAIKHSWSCAGKHPGPNRKSTPRHHDRTVLDQPADWQQRAN